MSLHNRQQNIKASDIYLKNNRYTVQNCSFSFICCINVIAFKSHNLEANIYIFSYIQYNPNLNVIN